MSKSSLPTSQAIRFPVANTFTTLYITPRPGIRITHQAFVDTLTTSRNYIMDHRGSDMDNRPLSPADYPFNSTKFCSADCLLYARNPRGRPEPAVQRLTYNYMRDTLFGLRDYTFGPEKPFRTHYDGVIFNIEHKGLGLVGVGALTLPSADPWAP